MLSGLYFSSSSVSVMYLRTFTTSVFGGYTIVFCAISVHHWNWKMWSKLVQELRLGRIVLSGQTIKPSHPIWNVKECFFSTEVCNVSLLYVDMWRRFWECQVCTYCMVPFLHCMIKNKFLSLVAWLSELIFSCRTNLPQPGNEIMKHFIIKDILITGVLFTVQKKSKRWRFPWRRHHSGLHCSLFDDGDRQVSGHG